MDALKEKLKFVDCPTNWHLSELKDRKPASIVIERLKEKEEEIAEPWVHVCIMLTLAYLHSENRDYIKSIEILKECDNVLTTSSNDLIVRCKNAFQTIYNASRAITSMMVSTASEAKQFADKIVSIQDLNDHDQAAVYAIKANVFLEFGVTGSLSALQYAKDALQKNPQEPDWHFLMGKLLSRIRHFSQDHEITAAELSHLQTAFSISQTPRAAIFLANACIEKSRSLKSISYKNGGCHRETKNKIKELTSEAKRLIQFALNKNQDQCIHILIRCAYGLTKLPCYDRDYQKAKELLEESFKRSPSNAMANKLAGDICLQEEKPMYHKALKHFEIAASKNVFSANFSMFDIQVKLSMSPNSEAFYAKILKQFTEKSYQLLTFLHATEYYLFIKRDLLMAVNYFMKAIKLDKDFHGLSDRWVKCVQKNINFYELIANEVRYAIDIQLYSDRNQLNILGDVIKEISDIKPEIMKAQIIPNNVKVYIESYEQEKNTVYGRGRGQGRGNRRGSRGRGGRGRGRGNGGFGPSGDLFHNESSGNKNVGRGNNRGKGSNRPFVPRSRSSSRNRVGDSTIKSELVSESKGTLANSQSQFDKVQFDRISYGGDKREEVMENPYFVKFLELKYKKLTNIHSFQQWLLKFNEDSTFNVSKTKNKERINANSDEKFQELLAVIYQLKEEINEIKLNDTRSCCSADHYRNERCHSLKSLQYNRSSKLRKPEDYFSDKNERYGKKYMIDNKLHGKYRERNERHSGLQLKDKYRGHSEDRIDRYHRSPSPKGRGKYSHKKLLEVSSDSFSSDSRSKSSDGYENQRRSRRNSFSDKKVSHKTSRHRSPYKESRYHSPPSPSNRRGRSRDRRDKYKYYKNELSCSSSSSSDSRSYKSSKEKKLNKYDLEPINNKCHQYHRYAETEYHQKPSSQKKIMENQRTRKSSCEVKSGFASKQSKKRDSSSSSSSSYHDMENNKKSADYRSLKSSIKTNERNHAHSKPDGANRQSCSKECDYSSSESKSDRKSVSQKTHDKRHSKTGSASTKDRKDKYSCEKPETKNKSKNNEDSSERHVEKYLHSGGRSVSPCINKKSSQRYSDSKLNKKCNERFETATNLIKQHSSRKNPSRAESLERDSYDRVGKDKSSRKPPNSKDEDYPNNTKCEKNQSHHKSSSSGSEWEDISMKKKLLSNVDMDKDLSSACKKESLSDRDMERRYCRSLSHDDYEKTSSG